MYQYNFSTYADNMPHLHQLQVLRSSSGEVVRVRERVGAHWRDVATQLGFSTGLIGIINENNGPQQAFDDMMTRWLNGMEGTRQPITWRTLVTVLRDMDHGVLASDLESILPEALSS